MFCRTDLADKDVQTLINLNLLSSQNVVIADDDDIEISNAAIHAVRMLKEDDALSNEGANVWCTIKHFIGSYVSSI